MTTGFPERIARNFSKLEPGHVQHFSWLVLGLALLLTAAFAWLVLRTERSPYRGVTYWGAGLTLIWGLLMTLLLSWIDYGKSYRPVADSLRRAMPAKSNCMESRGLGEAQRAAFDYHAGIVTLRAETNGATRCSLLLVQASPDAADRIGKGWKLIWEGSRPRARERYRLYRKL
jgi:4-amino-4-deoxy-L-arabinose transferase-like glycosyltransferase